ncbi:MAG: multicopper oxidase family protein [Candidatus Rokuibacteriota bacterium]
MPTGFTRLRVVEGGIDVERKRGVAYRILQDNGEQGFIGVKGGRFQVALENETREPTSIHWHGLILPNGQDGVPYVTQPPIKPGERRLYDFPIVQAGTFWMHSHFGLQEQQLLTAPLILRDPQAGAEDHEAVVILNDFTTRDPLDILTELKGKTGGMAGMPMGKTGEMAGMPMGKTGGMAGMAAGKAGRMAGVTKGGPDLNDVTYDALLANRRTLADPEVVRVRPGERVRLRLIAGSSATNFFIRTGALSAEAVAVDGEDIVPLAGTTFELGIAQRLDLRVKIPAGQGVYPIIAQGEGSDLQAGVILATPQAAIPRIAPTAKAPAGALTNTQESRLRSVQFLPVRPVDRKLQITLDGKMVGYVWMLNDQTWPRITPLEVKKGERVEIAFVNRTGMTHPMHLHGHVFQVTEIDGRRLPGAKRDTVLVMPRQTVRVQFDAGYPGYWMLHCHVLYHLAAGMVTVLKYQGFENAAYDPLASASEYRR